MVKIVLSRRNTEDLSFSCNNSDDVRNNVNFVNIKGDGNDGEPDARRKLEFEKKGQNWLELKNYGWFGMIFENIQSDLPNEVRGQS